MTTMQQPHDTHDSRSATTLSDALSPSLCETATQAASTTSASQEKDRTSADTTAPEPVTHVQLKELATVNDSGQLVDEVEETFPDGGLRAWLVILGATHITFATFGLVNAWGVFQGYYQEQGLSGQSASSIAWVGSIEYSLVFMPSVVLGRLMDIGIFLLPFTIGCVVFVVSIFLTAQTTEYYQVLLAQGILLGLSAGVLFGPTLAIAAHWFKKRRSLAFGVIACGASAGGTVFPILVRQLIPKIGFPWTLRVCGFLVLYCVGVGWVTVRPRLRPRKVQGGMLNLRAFRSPPFALYVVGCFFIMLGLYTPLSYLDVSGTAAGLGSFATYLVSLANAASIVGRLMPGYFADKCGPVNMLLPASFLAGIMMFVWPVCQTRGALVAFACIYGAACGAFVSLFNPGVAQLGETYDVGRRMGMLNTCLSIAALVGPPISGAVLTSSGGSFMHVAGFSGSVVLVGVAALFTSRYCLLGGLWGKM